jgi:hypothetical protein
MTIATWAPCRSTTPSNALGLLAIRLRGNLGQALQLILTLVALIRLKHVLQLITILRLLANLKVQRLGAGRTHRGLAGPTSSMKQMKKNDITKCFGRHFGDPPTPTAEARHAVAHEPQGSQITAKARPALVTNLKWQSPRPRWSDMVADADEEEEQYLQELQRLKALYKPEPPPPTADDVVHPPRWRLYNNGKYSSKLSPESWLTTTTSSRPYITECTTGQPGSHGNNTDDNDASGPSAPLAMGPRACLALGLGVVVSLITPASGSANIVDVTATCINSVGPTGQPGAATGWWILWHAVFTICVVFAALVAYTIWLFRYVGIRVPSDTADASTQTSAVTTYGQTRRIISALGVVQRGAQVAPPNILTVPYGRCYHIHGCFHTRAPRSTHDVFLLKDGLINFKRCEHCMPSAGRPHPRCIRANYHLFGPRPRVYTNFTPPILVDQEIPSQTILQFLGAHEHHRDVWSRERHWIGDGCGKNCGCCRASNPEDFGTGCESCQELWYFKTLSRSTRYRVSLYDGLWTRLTV